MRACEVYVHGIKAGTLSEVPGEGYVFAYDRKFLSRPSRPPVSLTLPLRREPYRSATLFPFFFNMLSEGANRQTQSQLLHIAPEDDFGILLATAHTDTIGAVTVKAIEP